MLCAFSSGLWGAPLGLGCSCQLYPPTFFFSQACSLDPSINVVTRKGWSSCCAWHLAPSIQFHLKKGSILSASNDNFIELAAGNGAILSAPSQLRGLASKPAATTARC